MNNWIGIGNLTKDPEIAYRGATQMAVCRFTIAIDRPSKEDGTKQTDYPQITVFGKQAENCEKYLKKGSKVAVSGSVQTGSYQDRNGNKVYTTGIVANRVEFLTQRQGQAQTPVQQNNVMPQRVQAPPQMKQGSLLDNFEQIDEELPF